MKPPPDNARSPRRGRGKPAAPDERAHLAGQCDGTSLALRECERRLRESEDRYRQVFEINHAIKLIVDPATGAIVEANRAACDFYGYSREALTAMSIFDINMLPPDEVRQRMALARTADIRAFLFPHRLASGEERQVEVYSGPVTLSGRTLLHSIIHDVTDRERAARKEQLAHANLRAFFDVSSDYLSVLDENGAYLSANRAMLEVLGYSEDEIRGASVLKVHPPEGCEEIECVVQAMLAGRETVCQQPLCTRDGRRVPVETRIVHGTWNGRPALFGISRDMTERELHARLLRDAHDRLEQRVAERTAELQASGVRVSRLNDVLRSLRAIGTLIVTEKDPVRLLQCLCESLVRTRGYVTVWIGEPESFSHRVRLSAHAGFGGAILAHAATKLDDIASGRGPTGTALRERRAVVSNDVAGDARLVSFRSFMGAGKVGSIAAIPLMHRDRLHGVLTVYADQAGAFNEEEVALLVAMACDVAHALQSLEDEKARMKAERELREAHALLEQRVAERTEALRTQTSMLSGLLDSIPDIVFFKDLRGTYLGCNPEFARFVGRRRGDIVGKMDHDLFDKVTADAFLVHDRLAMDSQTSRHNEEWILYPDGQRALLDTAKAPLRDVNGTIMGVVGIARDITIRKQLEQSLLESRDQLERRVEERTAELRSSEEIFRTLFTTMEQGVIYTDAAGVVVGVNPAAAQILGIPSDGLLGSTGTDIVARFVREDGGDIVPEDLPFAMVTRSGQPVRNLILGLRDHGREKRWLLMNAVPEILLGGAGAHRVFTMFTDITDLRRAEEALRLMKFTVDRAADAVAWLRPDGTFAYVNGAMCRLLGRELGSLQDRRWEDVSPVLFPTAWTAYLDRVRREKSLQHETVHRRPDKAEVRLDIRANFVDFSGQQLVCGFFIDITARKQLEAQLRHSQRMESIGRLAGGVAHDFNNCMYCVLGFSEMLMDALPPKSPLRAHVTQIQASANQAADITKQLLAFSRKQMIQPRPVEMNQLIRDQKKMLQRLAGEGVRIELDLGRDGDIKVVADPTQVQQVFLNLCANARDAMPHGGTMTIATRHVASGLDTGGAGLRRTGAFARVSVEDTGCGMSPDILEHIFDPFFTTKPSGKGTGLGLPVVHGIVEQHGGWIEVDSREGAGTRFDLYFPAVEAVEASRSPDAVALPPRGKGEVVLLVEDSPGVRRVLTAHLQALGYAVIEAESLQAGRAAVHAGSRIDVLLSDVVLPDGSGVTLAEEVAQLSVPPKIVMMSGYADEQSRYREIAARKWVFITKPCSRQALAEIMQAVLQEGEPTRNVG